MHALLNSPCISYREICHFQNQAKEDTNIKRLEPAGLTKRFLQEIADAWQSLIAVLFVWCAVLFCSLLSCALDAVLSRCGAVLLNYQILRACAMGF